MKAIRFGGFDGAHRSADDEPGAARQRHQPGRLHFERPDHMILRIELDHAVLADERDVPEGAVRLDGDVVRLGGRTEPHRGQVDRADELARRHVHDRHLGVVLDADVEQVRRAGRPAAHRRLCRSSALAGGVRRGQAGRAGAHRGHPQARPHGERDDRGRRKPPHRRGHLSAVRTMNSPCSMLFTMITPLLKNGYTLHAPL